MACGWMVLLLLLLLTAETAAGRGAARPPNLLVNSLYRLTLLAHGIETGVDVAVVAHVEELRFRRLHEGA